MEGQALESTVGQPRSRLSVRYIRRRFGGIFEMQYEWCSVVDCRLDVEDFVGRRLRGLWRPPPQLHSRPLQDPLKTPCACLSDTSRPLAPYCVLTHRRLHRGIALHLSCSLVSLRCDLVSARMRRAVALEAKEHFTEALADFQAVLRLDPSTKVYPLTPPLRLSTDTTHRKYRLHARIVTPPDGAAEMQMLSVTGGVGPGLDTDTVKLTIKTLLSHSITREFNSSTNYLRTPYVRFESGTEQSDSERSDRRGPNLLLHVPGMTMIETHNGTSTC
eukprot:430373-Pyramimonas_sp.AAC.1